MERQLKLTIPESGKMKQRVDPVHAVQVIHRLQKQAEDGGGQDK